MTLTTKTYATIFDHAVWGHPCADFEITSEQDILAHITPLIKHEGWAMQFNTYEVSSFTAPDGEVLTGKPKNHSPHSYANVEKVYTRAEVALEMVHEPLGAMAMADVVMDDNYRSQLIEARKKEIEAFAKGNPASVFFKTSPQDENFIEATPGMKLFGKTGRQLYPLPLPPSFTLSPQPE